MTSEDSKKDNTKKERQSWGGLKPAGKDDYQIDNKWGGLKPQKKLKEGDKVGKYGIHMGSRGVYDTRNELNDLTGREWAIFTKSWFMHNPPPRSKKTTFKNQREILHPAKFPETMISEFIYFFTKKGDIILDPFLGTGSTLVACDQAGRKGIGIEISEKWANIARKRTKQIVIQEDARNLAQILKEYDVDEIDFCITSPPYWDMLKKSRGHVKSAHKQREENGLDIIYSKNDKDLGNISDYNEFLEELKDIS